MAGITSANNGKLGGRPKGSKNWDTIAVEKAREYYLEQVAKHLPPLVSIHLEEAFQPENQKEREYALNQILGKPKESVEVDIKGNLKVDV